MKTIFKIFIICIISISSTETCIAQRTKSIRGIDTSLTTGYDKSSDIYVYDYEGIFTNQEKIELSEAIIKHKEKTKKEILIVTTPSIGEFVDIQEYANNIGSIYSNEIKNENIVTIAISKNLKEIAIATSPKAREILTNETCKEIIDKIIIPEIKKGNLYNGIWQGMNELIIKWNR